MDRLDLASIRTKTGQIESGGTRLARNLKVKIDPDRIEAYRSTVSLPFEPRPHKRVAVKIVNDRGIESLNIIPLP